MLGIGFVCLLIGCLMLGIWVCLFVCWVTYVRHWVCLLIGCLMLGIGFVCLIIISRLLTTMLTLILASQYVVQNHTAKDTSLTVSGGS